MDLYMRIAPELYLKRLVVGGFDRVYEIGRNFRNEGMDRQHNPEFTMLEFYQAYATYQDLLALTEELFCQLATEIRGGLKFEYQGAPVDFTPPWPRVSMMELGRSLKAPLDDLDALRRFCVGLADDSHGQIAPPPAAGAASWGELVGFVFDAIGEHKLDPSRPTFVVDYPADISPLSRKRDADPRLTDRFELFIVGREHANGFSELNDPEDQRARFQRQLDNRARGDAETMDYDEDYCRALEYGMPPTAGEGIGIDRLVMLLCDQPSIRDVILFPLMRPE
jgi:lysyl-tRNA synthetase class 2